MVNFWVLGVLVEGHMEDGLPGTVGGEDAPGKTMSEEVMVDGWTIGTEDEGNS